MDLRNDFHGTSARTRRTREELLAAEARFYQHQATPADFALRWRLKRKLCGSYICKCGDTWGAWPKAEYQ